VAKQGTNRVVDRILTTLNAASGFLAAELDVQDADYGDGIALADIPDRDMHYGDANELPPPQNLPALYVIPRGYAASEYLFSVKDVRHTMDVQVFVAHTDAPGLQKRLWRYARAVEKVIEDRVLTGGDVHDVQVTSVQYSPLAPWRDTGLLIQGVGVTLELMERVDRPHTV